MINALVILLFVLVFLLEYIINTQGISARLLILLPEALSGLVALIIVGRAIAGRTVNLDRRYVIFFVLLSLTMLFGFVSQAVSSGAIVAGLRSYLKFVPFFLLPAVYPFTRRQLKMQFFVLLMLLALQAPLALYQRFVQFGGKFHTGDFVAGSVTTSGIMTLVMSGGIAAIVVLYLRRRISLLLLLLGMGMLFLPMTINETKATVVLGPIAMLLPVVVAGVRRTEIRRLAPVMVMGLIGAVIFVQAYNSLAQYQRYGRSIQEFFNDEVLTDYLYTQAADGKPRALGRVDSIILAVRQISSDPLSLTVGLGAGNASPSPIARFSGEYADYFVPYGIGMTQISTFLWEIGFVGLGVYLLFLLLIFMDARLVARHSDERAALGQTWATVTVIMGLGLFYAQVFSANEIGYLFWFFSGLVAVEARRLRQTARAPSRAAVARVTNPAGEALLPEVVEAHR